MSASAEFTEYIKEKLEILGAVTLNKFFGGIGISYNSVQFAMVMGNTLYFVVAETSRESYTKVGMQPFSYATKKGTVFVKKYYSVPEEILEDTGALKIWAQLSIRAAHAASKKITCLI